MMRAAPIIGGAPQKLKIPKSSTVNFDRAAKIFHTKNLQVYVIIIKNIVRAYITLRAYFDIAKYIYLIFSNNI